MDRCDWMGSVGSIGLIGSKGVPFSRDSNKGEDWSAMLLPMTRTVWYDRGFIANSENVRQLIFAWGLNIRPNIQWFPEDSFVYLLTMLQCLPMDSSFVPKDSLFYLRCIIFLWRFDSSCTSFVVPRYRGFILCLKIQYLLSHFWSKYTHVAAGFDVLQTDWS